MTAPASKKQPAEHKSHHTRKLIHGSTWYLDDSNVALIHCRPSFWYSMLYFKDSPLILAACHSEGWVKHRRRNSLVGLTHTCLKRPLLLSFHPIEDELVGRRSNNTNEWRFWIPPRGWRFEERCPGFKFVLCTSSWLFLDERNTTVCCHRKIVTVVPFVVPLIHRQSLVPSSYLLDYGLEYRWSGA